jgi:hypothetical protein
MSAPAFEERSIDELTIEDEASFAHVGLMEDLKQILRQDGYRFRVMPEKYAGRWDRALFLNLTYWNAEAGGDVLESAHLDADVVAHVAWHHLASRALNSRSPAALFFGEAIASAFDLYLVGRLLGHAPRSSFLATQVPAMAGAAESAGVPPRAFEKMLGEVARDPERAFEDLRTLLFDASCALFACLDAAEALSELSTFDARRFGPLLHHYELSNWVLHARAHADVATEDASTCKVDASLREAKASIDWLTEHWVTPRLRHDAC